MKKELTAEDFLAKLEGMHEKCASCTHLEYRQENSTCTLHNIVKSKDDKKCGDWRYFI